MSKDLQPYVGPRPFEPRDRSIFFGRRPEANQLVSLVIAHQVVLVHSPSGAGKTSLINAGLIPLLQEESFQVLPVARVRGLLPDESDTQCIDNVFVHNAIASWSQAVPGTASPCGQTLDGYLWERTQALRKEDADAPCAVIFDQFEELFTAYPDRWQDRKGFFEQLSQALKHDPILRVILVMREEYIADLEAFGNLLPGGVRTRFRLECLKRDAALDAIRKPVEQSGKAYAPGVAERLIDDLMTAEIASSTGEQRTIRQEYAEPVQLQVVCQNLWNSLQPGETEISDRHLELAGSVSRALAQYYEAAIKQAVERTHVREGQLRRWFEQTLITPESTRGFVFGGKTEAAGMSNAVVRLMEDLHLLRAESRGGATWYELSHDTFIEPIRDSNRLWLANRAVADSVRRKLEDRALAWMQQGQIRAGLLDESETVEAERWLASPEAADVGSSDSVLALINASRMAVDEAKHKHEHELEFAQRMADVQRQRAEDQLRANGRLRRAFSALVVVSVLCVVFAIWGNSQRVAADKSKGEAQSWKRDAKAQKAKAVKLEARAGVLNDLAESWIHDARNQKAKALALERKALEARGEAERARSTAQEAQRSADASKNVASELWKIDKLRREARIAWLSGDEEWADSTYRDVQERYKKLRIPEGPAFILYDRARNHIDDSDAKEALQDGREALELAKHLNDRGLMIECEHVLAQAYETDDKYAMSAECHRAIAEVFASVGNQNAVARAYLSSGDAAAEAYRGSESKYEKNASLKYATESYRLSQESSTLIHTKVLALLGLAKLYIDDEDRQKSSSYYTDAWSLCVDSEDRALVLTTLGDTCSDDFDCYLVALRCYVEAAKLLIAPGEDSAKANELVAKASARESADCSVTETNRINIPGELASYWKIVEALKPGAHYELMTSILQSMARNYYDLNQLDAVVKCGNELIDMYRRSGDPAKAIEIYRNLADLLTDGDPSPDNYVAAEELLTSALDMLSSNEDKSEEAELWRGIGTIRSAAGNQGDALAAFEKAVILYEELEDAEEVQDTLSLMADCARQWGKHDEAIYYYEQCLDLAPPNSDAFTEASTLLSLAEVYDELGQPDQTARHYEMCRSALDQIEESDVKIDLLSRIGEAYAKKGQYGKAEDCYQCILDIKAAKEYEKTIGDTYLQIAELQEKISQTDGSNGALEEAVRSYESSLASYIEYGRMKDALDVLKRLALAGTKMGFEEKVAKWKEDATALTRILRYVTRPEEVAPQTQKPMLF